MSAVSRSAPHVKPFLEDLAGAVSRVYGDRLISCAVFGSVARGTATPESDVDVLVVAEPLPRGRMPRAAEFQDVERRLGAAGVRSLDVSPIIKTPDEVEIGSPLFWDMTEEVILLVDRRGFLEDYLHKLREKLKGLGAYRVWKGSAWYWVLKRDFSPGEVFEL